VAPRTYPPYLREKARQLRRERKLTIDELAERLALPRTTIYYWVRDLPIPRTTIAEWPESARRAGNRAMQKKYRLLREAAYDEGRATFKWLCRDATFRDFVNLYIAEGYKRSRNNVSLANSDPAVIGLASRWVNELTENRVGYCLQYHADQDAADLQRFWADLLGTQPDAIRLQRKSNSSQMRHRTWRCRHGVLSVRVGDTYLRAKLQAWMDCLKTEWLHSKAIGV
jgi:transcriptional regulator with XRE-family HTH domain